MNKLITFFGKKNCIVILLLSFIASSVSILSYMYPFFFKQIIDYIEQHKKINIELLVLYGIILLIGITLQYFGNLAFDRYILSLYYKLKSIIFIDFLNINDREKKSLGVGVYLTRINAELDGAFSIINVHTFKSIIFLMRLLFALYISFRWNIYMGCIFTINIIMYFIAALLLKNKNGKIIKE
ncbi:MAG: hypothetical protein LBF75_07505 [Treponema sp.]|jgi:hypothetical protein|nr:hypothetical protein [Treponema sp.]